MKTGVGLNPTIAPLAKEREREAAANEVIAAAAAVSAPLDLTLCGHHLGTGFNRVYTQHFLATLKRNAAEKLSRFPGLFDGPSMHRARNLYEFDDVVTAPLHGYAGASDYSERVWRHADPREDSHRWLGVEDADPLVVGVADVDVAADVDAHAQQFAVHRADGPLGRRGQGRAVAERHTRPERLARFEAAYRSAGAPVLLGSWVPIVGDAVVLAAGVARLRVGVALLWIGAGKLGRYAAVAWLLS